MNTGHGHVRPREGGIKARCGGPAICTICAKEERDLIALKHERRDLFLFALGECRDWLMNYKNVVATGISENGIKVYTNGQADHDLPKEIEVIYGLAFHKVKVETEEIGEIVLEKNNVWEWQPDTSSWTNDKGEAMSFPPCSECKQTGEPTGEYPCPVCGRPRLHDEPTSSKHQEVFVVVAYDTDTERMVDCNVLTDLSRAQEVFGNLKIIYGGANVAMFSRLVNSIHIGAPITVDGIVQARGGNSK